MLNVKQAKEKMSEKLPDLTVVDGILYGRVFLFRTTSKDPVEGDFDPFFSVDVQTGEVRDFSVLTDGNIVEITDLFSKSRIEM